MKRKCLWGILILSLILSPVLPVTAQTGGYGRLSQLDFDQFPTVTAFLDVYDGQDRFIPGLDGNDLTLTENGIQRPEADLEELSPGLQLVIAINIAPPFAIQDISGQSRWSYLSQHLIQWLENDHQAGPDSISLISNDGLEITHSNKDDILQALKDYQPQPRETAPNLNILARAVDLAMDQSREVGMKPVVLYLSPPPSPEDITAIQNVTSRAREGNVRAYPWLVSAADFFDSVGADELRALSDETRGEFFAFSGSEPLPNLEELFNPLRGTYLLRYQSRIKSMGPHQLEITINNNQEEITLTRELDLDIQPPNPILITPPQEVERANPDPSGEPLAIENYQPSSLLLEAIIEFPDGHPRELKKTALLVDGEPAVSNTSPPFDQFKWDLSHYERDQTRYISVQAEDQLGLSRTSLQTPVIIHVNTPEPTISNIFQENSLGFLSLAGIVISALVLLILILRGVIQPKSLLPAPRPGNPPQNARTRSPREGNQQSQTWRKILNLHRGRSKEEDPHIASLEPYTEEAKSIFPQAIRLSKQSIHLGRDQELATVVLDHKSVSQRHAHLVMQPEKKYSLIDQGSEAGTWVNFQQIPPDYHVPIHHGDIIHFGKIGFTFTSANPDARKEVVITEENDS